MVEDDDSHATETCVVHNNLKQIFEFIHTTNDENKCRRIVSREKMLTYNCVLGLHFYY